LIEDRRTLLLYTAPDGTPMKEWSTISSFEGHELARGDRLTAVVDRGNYADIRRSANIEEFVDMFAVFLGSLVVMAVGWICRVEGLRAACPCRPSAGPRSAPRFRPCWRVDRAHIPSQHSLADSLPDALCRAGIPGPFSRRSRHENRHHRRRT